MRSTSGANHFEKHFRNRLGGQPDSSSLCRFAGFRKDVNVVRTSTSRPEIAYIRKVIPTNQKTQFRYLQFLIEDAAEDAAESAAGHITEDAKPTPSRIPKSLLFF
jgi:hypothetical protein